MSSRQQQPKSDFKYQSLQTKHHKLKEDTQTKIKQLQNENQRLQECYDNLKQTNEHTIASLNDEIDRLQDVISNKDQTIKLYKKSGNHYQRSISLLKDELKLMISHTKRFKIRIVVDFGSDGIALAYRFNDDLLIHDKWDSTKYHVGFKPKTIILLDENYNVLSFGEDAKYMYNTMHMMADKWMLFERFNTGNFRNTLTATNGKDIECSKVFIAVLKYLQEQINKKVIQRRIKKLFKYTVEKSDYQWIISVPSTWNNDEMNKLKQWAADAGLIDTNIEYQCKIVHSIDCAVSSIEREIANQKQEDNQKYIVIDAGGYTVDVVCCLNKAMTAELRGSCYIDERFCQLLREIFSDEWIDEFKRANPTIFAQLIHNFQESKHSFYQSQESKHTVSLPLVFVGFIQDKLENKNESDIKCDESIENLVSSCKIDGYSNAVSLSSNNLELDLIVWSLLFDHVIDPIIEHITNILQLSGSQVTDNLYLLGGLSASTYFQTRMRARFGMESRYKLRIIIPENPILSVVKGAAYCSNKERLSIALIRSEFQIESLQKLITRYRETTEKYEDLQHSLLEEIESLKISKSNTSDKYANKCNEYDELFTKSKKVEKEISKLKTLTQAFPLKLKQYIERLMKEIDEYQTKLKLEQLATERRKEAMQRFEKDRICKKTEKIKTMQRKSTECWLKKLRKSVAEMETTLLTNLEFLLIITYLRTL